MNKQGDYGMENNSRKVEIIFLLLISSFLISATNLFASGKKLIKEKSIQTQAGQKLTVDASGADVFVQSWDKNEAYVKIYGNQKAEEKMHFEIEKTGDGVKILAKKKSSSWFNFWNNGGFDVRIEVMLPATYNTDIKTSGGDIAVGKLKGKVVLNTSGGDITLNTIEGELYAETSGGDIKINNHNGYISLSTSGGDITVTKQKGDLKASTSGGDVHLDMSDGKIWTSTSGGDIDINYYGNNKGIEASTSGGGIHAKVPASFKASVYLETSGGDIESNFSNCSTSKVKRGSFKGEYNGGGESFVLKTSGGDITVDQN